MKKSKKVSPYIRLSVLHSKCIELVAARADAELRGPDSAARNRRAIQAAGATFHRALKRALA